MTVLLEKRATQVALLLNKCIDQRSLLCRKVDQKNVRFGNKDISGAYAVVGSEGSDIP